MKTTLAAIAMTIAAASPALAEWSVKKEYFFDEIRSVRILGIPDHRKVNVVIECNESGSEFNVLVPDKSSDFDPFPSIVAIQGLTNEKIEVDAMARDWNDQYVAYTVYSLDFVLYAADRMSMETDSFKVGAYFDKSVATYFGEIGLTGIEDAIDAIRTYCTKESK